MMFEFRFEVCMEAVSWNISAFFFHYIKVTKREVR
jgi:hypothetical protein